MLRGMSAALAVALATSLLLALGSAPRAMAETAGSRPAVVLELFTSQGCSSCPAADRVLSRVGGEPRHEGSILVPLAFHVDYWNRIGWIDPFSSPRWSARQRRYAERFGLRSVYTPQVVVNGRAELVGSHEGRLRAEIVAAAAARAEGRIEILAARLDGEQELVVDLAAELGGETGGAGAVANLALFESGLVTHVESGENARRTLENDYVVRLLRPAILLDTDEPARRERLRVALEPQWTLGNLGLAAFLQDSASLEIQAATVLPNLATRRQAASAERRGRLAR